jgi:phospholipase/carboxylesterase
MLVRFLRRYIEGCAVCALVLGLALGTLGCKRAPSASPPAERILTPAKTAPAEPAAGGADNATASIAPADLTGEIAGVHVIERTLGGALASERLPVVVALHPLDGDPTGFFDLLGTYPKKARLVLPYGQPSGGGYRWFDFNPGSGTSGLPGAVERVAGVLRVLATRAERPTEGLPIVLGFSQGAMVAYALAVRHPDLVRGVIPISGMLAPTLIPDTGSAGQRRPPVLAFHGSQDPVFPVQRVRDALARLRQLGFEATLHEYPVAHETSPDEERDIRAAVARLAGSGP